MNDIKVVYSIRNLSIIQVRMLVKREAVCGACNTIKQIESKTKQNYIYVSICKKHK